MSFEQILSMISSDGLPIAITVLLLKMLSDELKFKNKILTKLINRGEDNEPEYVLNGTSRQEKSSKKS